MNFLQTKFSKLNFPTFEYENPSGWIYKCDRFFKINGIGDHEKVGLASLHLKGRALEWFQGYEVSDKEIHWQQFSIDVISRFGPSTYDNPIGQITKLK